MAAPKESVTSLDVKDSPSVLSVIAKHSIAKTELASANARQAKNAPAVASDAPA